MLKMRNKGMQCRKRADLQNSHPTKAATTAVDEVLQESQPEAVETPRKKQ